MGTDETLRYYIVRPRAKHPSFVLVCYRQGPGRKKIYQDLTPALRAQLSALNTQYLDKTLSLDEAELLLKEMIQAEYRKAGVRTKVLKDSKISAINQKLLNAYWEKVYSSRFLVDEKSPRYALEKALRLIDPLSLQAAKPGEILAQLKRTSRSQKEMRRAIDRLNQLMKFLSREALPKPPPQYEQIDFLTEPEIRQVMKHLTGDVKNLIGTLFGSGLRLSEALALTPRDLVGQRLNVDKQLRPDGLKPPKRGKTGRSLVIPEYVKYAQEWVKVTSKESLRTKAFSDLTRACALAKVKVIGVHDLRHSHAIYLLTKGATLKQVAFNLRNRTDVCERYYTGYVHTDETLEGLQKLIEDLIKD